MKKLLFLCIFRFIKIHFEFCPLNLVSRGVKLINRSTFPCSSRAKNKVALFSLQEEIELLSSSQIIHQRLALVVFSTRW